MSWNIHIRYKVDAKSGHILAASFLTAKLRDKISTYALVSLLIRTFNCGWNFFPLKSLVDVKINAIILHCELYSCVVMLNLLREGFLFWPHGVYLEKDAKNATKWHCFQGIKSHLCDGCKHFLKDGVGLGSPAHFRLDLKNRGTWTCDTPAGRKRNK